jgi:hypothetical protein
MVLVKILKIRTVVSLIVFVLLAPLAFAHVGSPDVYYQGQAGPYTLLVVIRPPAVIPGVAAIEVRSLSAGVNRVEILPLQMVVLGARLAPTPDVAQRLDDPKVFYGKLWIMERGSWKVQITVDGDQGKAEMAVPVAAVSATSLRMQTTLGILLGALGLLLAVGLVGIIGAANREAELDPTVVPSPTQIKRAWWRMAVAAVLVLGTVFFAGRWWKAEANDNARLTYQLPHLGAFLAADNALHLQLDNPNVSRLTLYQTERPDRLRLDDLVPDHGHLLHLFLVRVPDMRSFWHLHPGELHPGEFTQLLPAMPAGQYRIYSDIVHHTGFPETQIGAIHLMNDLSPAVGKQLSGDDAGEADLIPSEKIAPLADGYRMVWERDAAPLRAKQPLWFRFRIEDKDGKPASGLEDYMGMAGHAVFISNDGTVFSHVHPAGSVSMAALAIAQGRTPDQGMAGMDAMDHGVPSAVVSFLYGFPLVGDYRIFVQVKRNGRVETGSFMAHVAN